MDTKEYMTGVRKYRFYNLKSGEHLYTLDCTRDYAQHFCNDNTQELLGYEEVK